MKKYLYVKRFLDFVFACILLVVTLPILLAVAIAIKLESEGPALFLQKRVGKNGKIFCVYKFRTMLDKSKENYRFLTDYDRVTRVGSLLRRTSIDELPQLINILRGDMSFIGPRPLLAEYLPYYSKREMKRHDVLPGITGWAQVNGRNSISWEDKFRYDLEYVEKISLKLDLVIMVLTIHRLIAQTDTERISIPDFDYERRNMKAL
ncbi:MAG: sugar transferase [Caldicoprobacterales bacterium]|jgi:undecaprenyl phosphate N,N'-diacetylbacillosamine 1-phosphate transferase|nr:sugar transferase [Clostridiales bacterium]